MAEPKAQGAPEPPASNSPEKGTFDPALAELEYMAMFDAKPTASQRDGPRWGLALSGGGVRSATFALGFLQGLAKLKILPGFHYLSTVSGGGFIGAYLQGMLHRKGLDGTIAELTSDLNSDTPVGQRRVKSTSESVRHLRRHSNYLSPDNTPLSGDRLSVGATYLTNLVLLQILIAPVLLLLAFAVSIAYQGLLEAWKRPTFVVAGAVIVTLYAAVRLARRPQRKRERQLTGQKHELVGGRIAIALLVVFAMLTWPASGHVMDPGTPYGGGLAFLVAYLAWTRRDIKDSSSIRRLIGGLCGAIVVGLGMWGLGKLSLSFSERPRMLLSVLVFGTTMLFAVVFAAGTVALGFSRVNPGRRSFRTEHWARASGIAGSVLALGLIFPLVATFLPSILAVAFGSVSGSWIYGPLFLLFTGLAGWGLGVAVSARSSSGGVTSDVLGRTRRMAIAAGPWALLAAALLLYSWSTLRIVTELSNVSEGVVGAKTHLSDECDRYQVAIRCQSKLWQWQQWREVPAEALIKFGTVLVLAVSLWFVLFNRLDKNEFSMGRFYRNRLVRCYLRPSRRKQSRANWDSGDDILLEQLLQPRKLAKERPLYPLVCCAANLTTDMHLDWQDRKAGSFVFSPLRCGHISPRPKDPSNPEPEDIGDSPADQSIDPLRVRESLRASPLAGKYTLGDAISVSGAAVSPQMGERSSTPIAFVLTLLNVRLGRWVENHFSTEPRTVFSFVLELLGRIRSELLCISRGNGRFVYVSDGGHFENLGIYELVRRKCRFIVCVDASADPDRTFSCLGNAIHKCRVDFGVEIDLDVAPLRPRESDGRSLQPAVLGKIFYQDNSEGLILYVKPTLKGDEPPDVLHYGNEHPEFPHEPTIDQSFDERQFEAYRHLGFVACRWTFRVPMRFTRKIRTRSTALSLNSAEAKQRLLLELRHRLYEPSSAVALHFSVHGRALDQLFKSLRADANLRSLDPYLFPGFPSKAPSPTGLPPMPSPGDPEFTACFYFSQEQIQLMEAVYIDLDLESNHAHPDNRGWMNMFRQWSWAPVFRIAWALSSQTRGARFVRFCEMRLGLPPVAEALGLGRRSRSPTIAELRSTLGSEKAATVLELQMLESDPLQRDGTTAWTAYPLLLKWDRIFRSGLPEGLPSEQGVGLAVLADAPGPAGSSVQTLVFLRVQDHIRNLGFGTEFIRLLVGKNEPIESVDILPGVYKGLGVVSSIDARGQADRIRRILQGVRV